MRLYFKQIEETDNLRQYLECVKDLNTIEATDSLDGIKQKIRYRPSNIITFIGCDENGTVVTTATVIMEHKLRYNRPCCHIEDVATHPNHRSQGYATNMIQYCVEWAGRRECYKIQLNCADNLVDFYQKLGFVGSQNHMIYKGQ